MFKIVVSNIGGHYLYVSQNSFRMLDSKGAQEAAAIFPEFEVRYLDEILHHGTRRLFPPRGHPHNGEADGPSHPGNEFLPCLVITRPGAETDEVFQGQRRIPHRSRAAPARP